MKFIIKGHGNFKLYQGIEYADNAMDALQEFLKSFGITYTRLNAVVESEKGRDYFSVRGIKED